MESDENIEITEKDVMELMNIFTKVPVIILKRVVSRNSNVVKKFQSQINSYKDQLSDEEIAKINKVMEMPVPQLQRILQNVYDETHQKQLKILADPKAEPFIVKNLQELKKVLFN
ncbi:MAG: hypothetical protein HZC47_03085 [Methanobacterium sp.]|uniref:hypothetical protein n=1 Tax=Methanobacterium sp. TaxID=2164 RepID=UPI003D65B6D7|nr:hypothetical protein [Methanobacterium sp.]